jgi:hypothetical protein
MGQEGKAGGKGVRQEKENRRNVRVIHGSTSRIVDITETKDGAKDERDK